MTENFVSDVDLNGDEEWKNPHSRVLRDADAAMLLNRTGIWAISRYKDVRECLRNAEVFSSAIFVNSIATRVQSSGMAIYGPPSSSKLRF